MPIILFRRLNVCPGITDFSSTIVFFQEVLNENKPEHQYKKDIAMSFNKYKSLSNDSIQFFEHADGWSCIHTSVTSVHIGSGNDISPNLH